MTTFALNPAQIAAVASLHAATPVDASSRNITPILSGIQLSVTSARVTAVATDRYIVTRLEFPLGDTAHTLNADEGAVAHVIILDSKEWQAIAKATATSHATVTFTTSDEGHDSTNVHDRPNVTVAHDYGQIIGEYRQVGGNYPPVARLFPEQVRNLDETVSFKPAFMTRATKAFTPNEVKAKDRNDIVWTMAAPDDGAAKAGKLGPVVLTAATKGDVTLRSLLQPTRLAGK